MDDIGAVPVSDFLEQERQWVVYRDTVRSLVGPPELLNVPDEVILQWFDLRVSAYEVLKDTVREFNVSLELDLEKLRQAT